MSYRVQILYGSCSYGQSEQNTKEQKVQKSTKKYKSTKVLITQPFFEIQTSDFAWQWIWIVQPNEKVQMYKKFKNSKNEKMIQNTNTNEQMYKTRKVQK